MSSTKWYFKPYVLIIACSSATAFLMLLLTLLLLPRSSEILRVVQWRMINAETFRWQANVEYRGWLMEDEKQRKHEGVDIDTTGWVDRREVGETKQRYIFRVLVDSDFVGRKIPIRVEGEARFVPETNFLRLDRIPQKIGDLRLDQFVTRWLRVDLRDAAKYLDIPIFSERRPLSAEDRQYLFNQFQDTPFFSILQRLKDDVVNGVETFHYTIRPEMPFLKEFFVLLETVRRGRELTTNERRIIDRFFANVKAEDGEIWIGNADYYLYRLFLRFNYNDGLHEGSLAITLTFSDFNQPMEIMIPEGEALNVSTIIKSLLPSIVNKLPLASIGDQNTIDSVGLLGSGLAVNGEKTGDEDSDQDGLTNALEYFYGSDPNNPDSDGDGIPDGAEVSSGYNPTGPGRLFDFGLSDAFGDDETQTLPDESATDDETLKTQTPSGQ
jgi:hypothetical protein